MYTSAPQWQEFYRRIEQKAASLTDPSTGLVASHLVHSVACPLCGSSSFAPRVKKHGFTYVTCRQCGLVFINPQLTPPAIRDVYNDDDVREFFFRELLLPYVERDQVPEFEARLSELQRLTDASRPRLLDIGCAAGLFLRLAEQRGLLAEGLELNHRYVEHIRRYRTLTVHERSLEEMRYPDDTFDIVTLWDVLEHLPNPAQTIREAARILRRGGAIGLSTINHDCINEKLLGDRWRYYQPPDHLCSFTPKLLERLLTQSGFTIIKIRHHYMFEVLADEKLRFLRYTTPAGPLDLSLNKIKKLVSIALAACSGAVVTLAQGGDLLTVYARKT